jgi:predicted RNA-binding protein Jag
MDKEQRRKMMPQTAQWVDEITRVFGTPSKIKAEENGHKIDWESNDERRKKILKQGR